MLKIRSDPHIATRIVHRRLCRKIEGVTNIKYYLFVCFPGVTTHCGCIFTAR
jgi:hypothetical protein